MQWNLLLFKYFFPDYNLNRIGHNYICFGNWKKCMIGNVCFLLSIADFEALQRGLKSFENFSSAFTDHIFLILKIKMQKFTSQQTQHIFIAI